MKQAITSILTSVLFLACNRATEHKEELNMHSFDQTAISLIPSEKKLSTTIIVTSSEALTTALHLIIILIPSSGLIYHHPFIKRSLLYLKK